MQIRWLRTALANLQAEIDFISRDSPAAAANMAEKIERNVAFLKDHPAMGRAGRVSGTRELVISGTPHIVPYRVRDNSVEILRVFHGARRWPTNL